MRPITRQLQSSGGGLCADRSVVPNNLSLRAGWSFIAEVQLVPMQGLQRGSELYCDKTLTAAIVYY